MPPRPSLNCLKLHHTETDKHFSISHMISTRILHIIIIFQDFQIINCWADNTEAEKKKCFATQETKLPL